MFYYIYQITNLVNNKIYVGVHKTHNMDDGYMGSGKVIKAAIKKYGLDNFKKDILETFDNSVDMYARETDIVSEEFLSRKDVYNLREGGTGGFDWITKNKLNNYSDPVRAKDGRKLANVALEQKYGENWHQIISTRGRAVGTVKFREKFDSNSDFATLVRKQANKASTLALSDSAKVKRKLTLKKIGHQQGKTNSQFGTCWMYCWWMEKNIKVQFDLVPGYIDQGWMRGRKNFSNR